jgi:hypothetical protein
VSVAAQTPDEARIAERYLSVLADVSRCAEAVRRGDWRQLARSGTVAPPIEPGGPRQPDANTASAPGQPRHDRMSARGG